MGYGPAMTPDYRPSLARSFERHLRAENRSEPGLLGLLLRSVGNTASVRGTNRS
jgi:hypothetical protein